MALMVRGRGLIVGCGFNGEGHGLIVGCGFNGEGVA